MEEETMEVDAQQGQGDLEKSDAAAGDYSLLLQKDREALLGLLPAKVWVNVTDMLLADDCTDDLKRFSDASPFFRDLLLSKRVLFLFPQVLKFIGPTLENEEHDGEEDKSSSIVTCRAVCKSWNKSVDQYINASTKPDFFQAPPTLPRVPRNPILTTAKYKYFGYMAPQRIQQFQTHFDQSHHRSNSGGPQRNPFIGTTVNLALCNELYDYAHTELGANLLNLLRKYGQYIRVLGFGLGFPIVTTENEWSQENYFWLKECLECTPNLTHLKVLQRHDKCFWKEYVELDPSFGEHAYRTEETGEYLRKRILSQMGALPVGVQQAICARILENHQRMLPAMETEDRKVQQYSVDEQLANLSEVFGKDAGLWRNELEMNRRRRQNGNAPHLLSVKEFRNAVAADPLPKLENLECLKLCKLYARVFNPLIESYRQITWLHIEPSIPFIRGLDRCVDWWTFDFPNLRKLCIKFSLCPKETRRILWNFHPSFMKLTSLHLEFPPVGQKYMGWADIFQKIELNWADTLIELKIRLPQPTTEQEKTNARNACENGRLELPKLKRLVMLVRTRWDDGDDYLSNFQFLNSIRENLEEFVVL